MSLNWWQNGYGSLGAITGTGPFNGQHFVWASETATEVIFNKVTAAGVNEGAASAIKFTKSTGIWDDYGSGWPTGIQNNGNYVQVYGYAWDNEFLNPNIANPYSSGGGTSTETLIKTVDNTPVTTGNMIINSFDPAAWLWDWYSVSNQLNDVVRTTIVNLVGQSTTDFNTWLTDKVSGITSAIIGAVIVENPDNTAEYVVTIDLPEAIIKDSIIFITDSNNNDEVIGEVDFEPIVQPVLSGKVFRNFW